MHSAHRSRFDAVTLASLVALALSFGAGGRALAQAESDPDGPCGCDVTPAHCDQNCACDQECAYDWTVDECAAPNVCDNTPIMEDAELDHLEESSAAQAVVAEAPSPGEIERDDFDDVGTASPKAHGCTSTSSKPGGAQPLASLLLGVPLFALALFRRVRRGARRLFLVGAGAAFVSCGGPIDEPGVQSDSITAQPSEAPATDTIGQDATPACHLGRNPPLIFMYANVGAKALDFLRGCPGEVVAGEKTEAGPRGPYRTAEAHHAGGRTGFILADFGHKIRDLLKRPNGLARTEQYLKQKLAAGYDYIIIDEITTDPDWADGAEVNRLFRQLLLRLPHKIIAYISLDLTKYPGGDARLHERRQLLRALATSGKAMALEVYLHTGEVMSGAAPGTFGTAANRLQSAVRGLRGAEHINRHAVTVIGLSMASRYPQYRYLDQPRNDLASITKQVQAIRHGNQRLREQNGVGYYFVGTYDIQPPAHGPYTFDQLIEKLRVLAGSWKRHG